MTARLVQDMQKRDGHIWTGILGMEAIADALCENGRADVAYSAHLKADYPSLGNMIREGATTLWEDLTIKKARSLNHKMFATPLGWMARYVAGLRVEGVLGEGAGFRKAVICPYPVPEQIKFAHLNYDSVMGAYHSGWRVTPEGMAYDIVISAEFQRSLPTAALGAANGDRQRIRQDLVAKRATCRIRCRRFRACTGKGSARVHAGFRNLYIQNSITSKGQNDMLHKSVIFPILGALLCIGFTAADAQTNAAPASHVSQPGAKETVSLIELGLGRASTFAYSVKPGKTVGNKVPSLGGKSRPNAFGTVGNCIFTYDLKGKGERLSGLIGIDDSVEKTLTDSVEVQVYGDNKRLWSSGPMKVGNKPTRRAIPGNEHVVFDVLAAPD